MVALLDFQISDDITIRRAQIVEVVLTHCATVLWPHKPEKLKAAASWASKLKHAIHERKNKNKSSEATPLLRGTSHLDESPAASPIPMNCNAGTECTSPRFSSAVNGVADHTPIPVPATTATAACSSSTATSTPSPSASSRLKSGRNGLAVASADVIVCRRSPYSRGDGDEGQPWCSSSSPPQGGRGGGGEGGGGGDCGAGADPDGGGVGSSNGVGEAEEEMLWSSYREGTAATRPDGDVVLVSSRGSPLIDALHTGVLSSLPLQVKRLSGGITNELFHVYDEQDRAHSVVVRVYGKETERVISRESELFYQALFINTYAHGDNFLIYEFLDDYDTLPYTEMGSEAKAIARKVAEFQVRASLAARRDRGEPLLPLTGDTVLSPVGVGEDHETPCEHSRFGRETNYTIHSLTKWVRLIGSAEMTAKVQPEKQADYAATALKLKAEADCILKELEKNRPSLGEGVCHNDLLSANIMRHQKTQELKLIDFDYTKRDFLLFDVANHFNEYTGLECDYARYFPSDEHMTSFVAAYRQAMREVLVMAHRDADVGDVEEIFPNDYALFWGCAGGQALDQASRYSSAVVDADEEVRLVEQWTKLVKFLTLASHLSWGVWSLVQEAVSALDVDFLDYSKLRLARYYETKDEYMI